MSKGAASKQLTIVIANYAREEQLHELIELLRKQTVKPYIWIWNNDTKKDFRDDRADWVVNSNRNVHVRIVSMFYQLASTPYVMSMDDDLYPADEEVFEDALQTLKRQKHRNQIVGAYGRVLMMRQDATHVLTCGFSHHHTDINTSTALAGRHRHFHTLAGCFWNRCDMADHDKCKPRLLDFPVDDHGYCAKDGHYEERNALCQTWARTCLPSRNSGPKPKPKPSDANS